MRTMWAVAAVLVGCAPFSPTEGPDYTRQIHAGERDTNVLRVVTWNIETVGEPGSDEYDAALDILARLQPDVLALNEIAGSWDADNAEWLAYDAGFDHYIVGGSAGYGSDRNAILSKFPLENADGLSAAQLSGYWRATDITREFVKATVVTPRGEVDVVSMHWKSGWHDDDEFRRVLEGYRAVQAVTSDRPTLLTGDWNDDIRDGSDWPFTFESLPYGLPDSFWLGGDLWSALNDTGLPNDPFVPLLDAGIDVLDIRQRSGTDATRPASGRRIDYIAATPDIEVDGTEVFDCRDQDRSGGVEHYGPRLPNSTCATAADHLPVIVDIVLGEARPVEPIGVDALASGDLEITEVLANPDACADSDGEWVEIRNTTDAPVLLEGLALVDASGNTGIVSEGRVEPGQLAILGRGDTPCGVDATATYGSQMSLNNSGDTVSLVADGTTVDSLSYTSGSVDPGLSFGVDAGAWCVGLPTPGADNAVCN